MQEADDTLPFSDTAAMQTTLARRSLPWWRVHPWLTALFTSISIALTATVIALLFIHHDQPLIYHTQPITRGNVQQLARGIGPIQSKVYDANFAAPGRVASIAITVGTTVKQGDQLAQLDTADLQDAFNIANKGLTAAQINVNVAQQNLTIIQQQADADLALAATQQQRANATCASDVNCMNVASQAYAAAKAKANRDIGVAQGQVNAAQGNLSPAQAQADAAQHNLQHATLYATHDGTIAAINGTIGTQVSNSGTIPFIQIADTSTLSISMQANELDVANIAKDNSATFTVSAFADKQFHGTVSAIAPIGTVTNSVTTYAVTVDIDMQFTQSVKILPGMTASVTIVTADRPNVLLLPINAISYAQTAAKNNTPITQSQAVSAQIDAVKLLDDLTTANPDIVNDHPVIGYVVVKQKKSFIVKPVVIGLSDGLHTEIVAGLNEGDLVVTGQEGSAPPLPTPRPTRTPTPTIAPTIASGTGNN